MKAEAVQQLSILELASVDAELVRLAHRSTHLAEQQRLDAVPVSYTHLHGVDEALRTAWQTGVVLTGVSAGSICWHVGGTTDSFGPQLQPITNGLGLVPYANGVHYDSEPQRRPLLHQLVGEGTLPAAYATDDGAGLLYRGGEFVEAVSENSDGGAYFVESVAGAAVETALDVRRL